MEGRRGLFSAQFCRAASPLAAYAVPRYTRVRKYLAVRVTYLAQV
jgi:hypothetical protein